MVFTEHLSPKDVQDPPFVDRSGRTYYEIYDIADLAYQAEKLRYDYREWLSKSPSGPPPNKMVERIMKIQEAFEAFSSSGNTGSQAGDPEKAEKLSQIESVLNSITSAT